MNILMLLKVSGFSVDVNLYNFFSLYWFIYWLSSYQ